MPAGPPSLSPRPGCAASMANPRRATEPLIMQRTPGGSGGARGIQSEGQHILRSKRAHFGWAT
eukprot:12194638-Alexandrium_andersonii.AAC.1